MERGRTPSSRWPWSWPPGIQAERAAVRCGDALPVYSKSSRAEQQREPEWLQFWINAALRSVIWLGVAACPAYFKKPDCASLLAVRTDAIGWLGGASCSPPWFSISGSSVSLARGEHPAAATSIPVMDWPFGTSGTRFIWQASRCCWAWACCIPHGVCGPGLAAGLIRGLSRGRGVGRGACAASTIRLGYERPASESRGGFLSHYHPHSPPNRLMQLAALRAAADRHIRLICINTDLL